MSYAAMVTAQVEGIIGTTGSRQSLIARIGELRHAGAPITAELEPQICADSEAFVRGMVSLLVELEVATQQVHISDIARPALEQAYRYFLDENDVLPDRLGVLGLLDDAYLSYRFLVRLSEGYQAATGASLFAYLPDSPALLARSLIGEPLATALDTAADQTIADLSAEAQALAALTPEQAARLQKIEADRGINDLAQGMAIISGDW